MSCPSLSDERAEPGDVDGSPCSRARAWSARLRRSPSLCAPDRAGPSSASGDRRGGDDDGGDRDLAGADSWQGRPEGGEASSGSPIRGRCLAAPRDTVPVPIMPDGETAPPAAPFPTGALEHLGEGPLGLYVHVPFCAATLRLLRLQRATSRPRTATTRRLRPRGAGRIRFARRVLGDRAPAVATVFFGGGTPTLLAPDLLAALLDEIRAAFGLADGAEVTVEANPETVTARMLAVLRDCGLHARVARDAERGPHVLAALDRRHTPGRAVAAAALAREAGFDHVSLDLIYGTPGETPADWGRRCAPRCRPASTTSAPTG